MTLKRGGWRFLGSILGNKASLVYRHIKTQNHDQEPPGSHRQPVDRRNKGNSAFPDAVLLKTVVTRHTAAEIAARCLPKSGLWLFGIARHLRKPKDSTLD